MLFKQIFSLCINSDQFFLLFILNINGMTQAQT